MKRKQTKSAAIVSASVAIIVAAMLITSCQSSKTSTTTGDARLYDGFGKYTRTITTDSRSAQKWFNQGMQLLYGFNHDEAIRSFKAAAAADPNAAMPWWGVAYANGIHVNNTAMSETATKEARMAADKAMARINNASPVEQALIRAVDARYTLPTPEDRKPLDVAYAAAMENAYKQFPNDPDVGTLFAESLMNLQPWDYWDSQGNPKARAAEIVAVLEGVLASTPKHPGANHFYIHAVEASRDPDRAEAAADRLQHLVPGAGHLVHMPSHIYIRVGRYSDAVDANARAVAADRAYFKKAPAPQFYSLYYAHNLHFLAYGSMMAGRYDDAIKAARDLENEVSDEALEQLAPIAEGIMPTNFHVMIRFGKWEEILKEPDYPEHRYVSRAVRRYARSIAYSALGETSKAREELAAFETAVAKVPGDWYIFNNKVDTVLPIARAMINGELLYREGKHDEAFALLREGITAEDALIYDEPPAWMLPVRHALGALLMGVERYEEAEQVYREDLERNRNNGWSLLGLHNALLAQGKVAEAAEVEPKVKIAWANADVKPTSSCYCQPATVKN